MKRIARGALVLAAGLVCACGRAEQDGRAERDTTIAKPQTVALDSPAAAPNAPAAGDSTASTQWVLRADGMGPVRVGMTVAQADSAVGGLNRTAGLEACDYVQAKNGPGHVSFMVENGRIVRADVSDSAVVATGNGTGLGATESRVRQAYPGLRVEPHKYDDRGHYLVVIPGAPADTLHRIVFETDGSVVTRMRGGLFPAVGYVEGCS